MLEYLNGMGHRVKEISLENKLYQSQWHFLWIGLLSFLILGCGEPKYTVVSGTVSQNEAVQKGTPITLTDEQGLPLAQDCVTDENGNYRCLVPRLQTTRVMQLQSGGATPMDSLIVKQKVPTSAITRHINPITNFIAHPSEPNGRHMRTGSSHQQVAAMDLEDKVAAYEAQANRVSEGLGVKADSFASSATFKPRVADDPNSGSVASDLLEVIVEQKSGRTLSPWVLEGVLDDKDTHIAEPVTQVRLASAALGRSEAKAEGVAKEFSEIVTSSTDESTKKAFQGVANAFGTVKTRVTQDESSRTAKSNHLMELALDSVESALVESLAGNNKEFVNIKTTKDAKNSEKLVNLANNMATLLKDPVAEAVEKTAKEGKLGYNAMKLLVSGAAINAASVALAANLTEKEPKNVSNIVKKAFERSETILKDNLKKQPYLDSEKEWHNVVAQSQQELNTIHSEEIIKIDPSANIVPPKISKGFFDSDASCPFVMDSPPNPAEVTAIDCSGRTLTQKSLDLRAYTQLERLILGNQQLTSIQGLEGLEQLQYLNASHVGVSTLPDLSKLGKLTYLDWGENGLANTLDATNLPSSLIQLHLTDNNLRGLSNLDRLTNLTELNLSQNHLKILNVSNLTNLTKLNLSLNSFEEINPDSLPTSLTELDLSYNILDKTVDVSKLTNLTKLSVRINTNPGNWADQIVGLDKLRQLTELNLVNNGNRFKTVDVSNLTNLTKLNVSENEELKQIVGLNNLTQLTELNLAKNYLSGTLDVSNLRNLTKLSLHTNMLSGTLDVSNLTNLTKLNLALQKGLQKLTQIQGLNNLTQLKELDLSHNQLTQIQGLDNLTQLTELNLSENRLSGSLNVGSLTKLTELNLFDNRLTQIQGLNRLENLTKLNLRNNELGNSNNSLDLSGLNKLTELNLGANSFRVGRVITGLSDLRSLKKLNFSYYNTFNQLIFSSLANLSNLEELNFQNANISIANQVNLGKLIALEKLQLDGTNISCNKFIFPRQIQSSETGCQ